MASPSCPSPSDFRFDLALLLLFSFLFFPFSFLFSGFFLFLGWHFPAHLIFFHRVEAVALYGVSNGVAGIQTFGALRQRGYLLLAIAGLLLDSSDDDDMTLFSLSLSSLSDFHWRR